MKLENELGEIRISSDVFTNVTGSAATNCYGVKGMAVRSTTDGLVHLLKREARCAMWSARPPALRWPLWTCAWTPCDFNHS